jgi:D-alanine-D-alanine ligase
MENKTINNINYLNNKLLEIKDNVHIIIIANIRESEDGNSSQELKAEFLSPGEFELITETYKNAGFEITTYTSELDFITHHLSDTLSEKTNIVVNYAQSGTTIGRQSFIPAFCQLRGIFHCESNPYSTCLSRHKFHSELIISSLGVPCTKNYFYHYESGWINNQKPKENDHVIAKLNYEASSIGLTDKNVFHYTDTSDALLYSISESYKQPLIVEEFIKGIEVECPIIKGKKNITLSPIEIKIDGQIMEDRILTEELRHSSEYTYKEFESDSKDLVNNLKNCAEDVINILDLHGYCRVDYRIDKDNNYFVTDIATSPGITTDTSFFTSFKLIGASYEDFLLFKIANTLNIHDIIA